MTIEELIQRTVDMLVDAVARVSPVGWLLPDGFTVDLGDFLKDMADGIRPVSCDPQPVIDRIDELVNESLEAGWMEAK